jgi:hypothetical protein
MLLVGAVGISGVDNWLRPMLSTARPRWWFRGVLRLLAARRRSDRLVW